MHKKELLETLRKMKDFRRRNGDELLGYQLAEAIALVEELDEPSPVEVHKLVAEWIEQCKRHATLSECLNGHYDTSEDWEERCGCFVSTWLDKDDNDLLLARAWLYGYTVVKEPEYVVVIDGLYLGEPINDISNYVEMTWHLEYAYKFKSRNEAKEHTSILGGNVVPVEEIGK